MAMKKFINDPANLTAELLDGLVQCYPNQLALKNERIVVRANPKPADKVAIVTLGGSGHEPAMHGFVGFGMLDACVAGDIFAAPGGEKVFEALEMFNRPAGVLLVTLNHNGDRMSANKAMRKAQKAGLNVKEIVIHEDIAQGPHTPIEDKRGLGGCIPFIKVVGAAAEEGKSLEEIVDGDEIEIDITNRKLSWSITEEELARRKANWKPLEKPMGAALRKYAAHVQSAAKGAIIEV